MRKVSMLIGICALVAFALTVSAQQPDLSPIMKQVPPTLQSLNKNLTANMAADVATDAQKLQTLFTDAQGFFKAHKAQDAVELAKSNADAAGEIVKAAKANNLEAAKAPAGSIGKSCKSCHDVHREQLPDK